MPRDPAHHPRRHPNPVHRSRAGPAGRLGLGDVSLGRSSTPGPARRTGRPPGCGCCTPRSGFLGGQVLAGVFVGIAAAARRPVPLADRAVQARRAADLVRAVDPLRPVGRLLRGGGPGQPAAGDQAPRGRRRAPLPVDRPARDPDRRGRPVPGRPRLHPDRPARPRLPPAVRGAGPAPDRWLPRSRPTGSSPRPRWSGRRSSRSSSSAACCCGPWPACSGAGAAGSGPAWPSWSAACSSGWPTPSRCSCSVWPCSGSSWAPCPTGPADSG